MGASAGKPPSAPDPSQILALQNQYNRSNSVGPFGSQSWSSGGPGGHETMTTSLSPQMQGAVDRAFSAAATPYQKEYVPQGMDQLASALLGKVGGHYGLGGQGFNTNLQQQKPAAGAGPQPPQGMGGPAGGMPALGNMQGGAPGMPGMGQMPPTGMPALNGLQGGLAGQPSAGGMPMGGFGGMGASGLTAFGGNSGSPGIALGNLQQQMPQQVI